MEQPLVDEAMKKAAVAWVRVGAEPAKAVWCMPAEGSLWVVTGPGEQQIPGLDGASDVVVTLRGSHGGRIVSWPATVTGLEPGTEQWDEVAPQLAGKRLNASGESAAVVTRWAEECRIHQLTPSGEPSEAGPSLPGSSLAEPPRGAPVARRPPAPFRLHRVRRR